MSLVLTGVNMEWSCLFCGDAVLRANWEVVNTEFNTSVSYQFFNLNNLSYILVMYDYVRKYTKQIMFTSF